VKPDSQELSLLAGLAKNDRLAVESIYGKHFGMVQSLIINNNGSSEDARDIFQEAMIVLYERSRSADFELQCQLKDLPVFNLQALMAKETGTGTTLYTAVQ
jgi:hypothetical protein